MKVSIFFALFILISNVVSADNNNIIIDNYEGAIINFETSFFEFYSNTISESSQWQYYANNVINFHEEINRILNNNRNVFTVDQIDRISKLNKRFASSFLINEQINRIELSQDNFNAIIVRNLVDITNVNMQNVVNRKQELQQYINILIVVIQLVPFLINEEHAARVDNLLHRQIQINDRLENLYQQLRRLLATSYTTVTLCEVKT
ncbi:MAG: hypothetical protein FWC97_08895 [Treponema sp.]|nr:hypothetical protein [Treponema sp.]